MLISLLFFCNLFTEQKEKRWVLFNTPYAHRLPLSISSNDVYSFNIWRNGWMIRKMQQPRTEWRYWASSLWEWRNRRRWSNGIHNKLGLVDCHHSTVVDHCSYFLEPQQQINIHTTRLTDLSNQAKEKRACSCRLSISQACKLVTLTPHAIVLLTLSKNKKKKVL